MFYRKIILTNTVTLSHLTNETDSNYYQKTCIERKVCGYYCCREQKHNNETTGIHSSGFDLLSTFHSFQLNF